MKVRVTGMAWFNRSDLSSDKLNRLKSALTLIPKQVGEFAKDDPEPVILYREYGNLFGVPPVFFLERRKPYHEIEYALSYGDKSAWTDLNFGATLREEQQKALNTVTSYFKEETHLGCQVQAPPGWG